MLLRGDELLRCCSRQETKKKHILFIDFLHATVMVRTDHHCYVQHKQQAPEEPKRRKLQFWYLECLIKSLFRVICICHYNNSTACICVPEKKNAEADFFFEKKLCELSSNILRSWWSCLHNCNERQFEVRWHNLVYKL